MKIRLLPVYLFAALAAFGQVNLMRTEMDGETMKVLLGKGFFAGGPITGAPYSAEQSSEHVQTLADGTHIRQPSNQQKIWRDSQGRTRIEQTMSFGYLKEGSFTLVQITDPAAGFVYVIDDVNKAIHRTAPPEMPVRRGTAPVAQRATAARSSLLEPLGDKSIEGLVAAGTRITNTVPIGQQGNDRPMTTVSENWFSKELRTTILSTISDPRMGESTTRLANISRAEPDPAMFMLPAGYAVVDEKDSFTVNLRKQ